MSDDADDGRPEPLRVVPFTPRGKLWEDAAGMIQTFADETRAGVIQPSQAIIVWIHKDPDTGRISPHYWHCNMGYADVIAFLEIAKAAFIKEWSE